MTMRKCSALPAALCFAVAAAVAPPVAGDDQGRAFVGIEGGVLIPVDELDREMKDGGSVSPFAGYMFNDYIGLMGQGHFWAAKTEDNAGEDDHTTMVAGGSIGPRGAIPMGPVELNATFQAGLFTSLASEALTDTSFGFSTGPGINFHLTDELMLGGFARWNRLYQRVHGLGDAKYITAGVSLTYEFRHEHEPPPPPPPPPPVRAEAPPPPKREPHVVKTFKLEGVHLDFDRSDIKPAGRRILDEAVQTLRGEEAHTVVIEGHTDSVGSDEYNERLSLRRANAVRDYLVSSGISSNRIEVKGFGESQPVADNGTPAGRAQNRRVELKVMGN